MPSHFLQTELRNELEAVELAWDCLLSFDWENDRVVIEPLLGLFRQIGGDWVLLGQRPIAEHIASFSNIQFQTITVEGAGPLSEAALQDLVQRVIPLATGEDTHVFVCLTDRYDTERIKSALGSASRLHTFDELKELIGERIPASAWRKTFDHIYPIQIPLIEIRDGLDILLLDMPARSLAQLPIGFAYVYKAIRQTNVSLQAIDVDLIAYHRYHSRRCMNYIGRVESGGLTHPQDPWQAENYIVWTDKKFIEYFSDILDEVVEKVIRARPKVVGLSLHQTSNVSVSRVVDRLREALPEICIIVGGMSCYQHFVAQRIFPQADYVVVGEADTVIGPLAEALARGERPADLPGIVSRYDSPDRTFVGAPLPHNLDIVGAPDYGFANLDHYVNWNGYRLMPLVGSRGCGWSRCTFCAERFNWRARTPETVAEEIEYYTTRGFKDFVFNESDFNSNLSFVLRLCQEIVRRGIKANFTAQLRVGKDCDFQYYKAMHEAGFSCLRFGVDALSESTLLLQRKGYTKQMVMDNLRHCHDLGIFTEINVVVGVPGETDEDIEEAADFIIQMKPYIGRVAFINPLMLFVGSVYYFEPERHKIKFSGNKEELYKQYFVSLPDSAWYSEEPYIDHNIRRQRFFRIVERIHEVGVPLGAFANFTAEFRKKNNEDSHTLSQPRPSGDHHKPALNDEQSRDEQTTSPLEAGELVTAHAPADDKTEFQKTFYGSWSSAFLSGDSWRHLSRQHLPEARVLRIDNQFYITKASAIQKVDVVKVYPIPTLLRPYKAYNLVGYKDQILGAPHVLGHVDLTQEAARSDNRIIKGGSEEAVTSTIDYIETAANMARPATPTTVRAGARFDTPVLLRPYKGYNLVGYRDQVLGAPLSLGPMDLTEESARMNAQVLSGETEDDVVNQINKLEAEHTSISAGLAKQNTSTTKTRKVNMGAGVLLRWGK
jgi:radical SAM superfamily enzyme YgiQ (UPF0313 family)